MMLQRCSEQLQTTEDKLGAALKVKEILEKERTDINTAYGQVMKNLQVKIDHQIHERLYDIYLENIFDKAIYHNNVFFRL